VPISNFGIYTAISVVATLVILFTYLPAALETFTPSFALKLGRGEGEAEKAAASSAEPPADLSTRMADLWAAFGGFVVRNHAVVSLLGVIAFVIGVLGIPKIQTSVHLLKMF